MNNIIPNMKIVGELDNDRFLVTSPTYGFDIKDLSTLIIDLALYKDKGYKIEVASAQNDCVKLVSVDTVITSEGKLSRKGNVPFSIEKILDYKKSRCSFNINGADLGEALMVFAVVSNEKCENGFIFIYLPKVDLLYALYDVDSNFEIFCNGGTFFKLCGKVPKYKGNHRAPSVKEFDSSHWIYAFIQGESLWIPDIRDGEYATSTFLDLLERKKLIRTPILSNISDVWEEDMGVITYSLDKKGDFNSYEKMDHFSVDLLDGIRNVEGVRINGSVPKMPSNLKVRSYPYGYCIEMTNKDHEGFSSIGLLNTVDLTDDLKVNKIYYGGMVRSNA